MKVRTAIRWTADEVARLTILYPINATSTVAQILNRSAQTVSAKAYTLGLKKTPEHISIFGARLTGTIGAATRFKPGNKPWTLGVKGMRLSPSTEFKKGQAPVNVQEVGALRINTLGDIDIKIAEGKNQWLSLRRYVWEMNFGAIPSGMCIVPIDGDGHNTSPDNLRLLTRADNIRHNLLARYPKQLRAVMQMGGRLRSQISKTSATHQEPLHA